MPLSLVSQKENLLVLGLCISSSPEAVSYMQRQKAVSFDSTSSLPMRNIVEAQAEHWVVLSYKRNHLTTLAKSGCGSK